MTVNIVIILKTETKYHSSSSTRVNISPTFHTFQQFSKILWSTTAEVIHLLQTTAVQ